MSNAEPDTPNDLPMETSAEPDNADTAATEATDTTGGDPAAEWQAKAEDNWDKYVRAVAELDNVRKRAARDVENAHRFALERFAAELLAVLDSLEMARDAHGEASVESLKEGSEATLKQLVSVLQRFGVEEVDPLGEPFDPAYHEAMSMQPSDTVEPGSVVTVFQKGYALNGRLLRPARVVVASEPPETA